MNTIRIEETPATALRGLRGSGLFGKAGLACSLLLAAVVTTATPAMAQTALNFSDPLTGPSSPYLTIDASKYGYTGNGLIRTQSAAGATYGNGNCAISERPMVTTVSGAFLTEDFEFDVDVNAPTSNSDLIYVGFGQGTTNPNYCNEPTDAFQFRIHNNVGGNMIQAAVDVGQVSMGFAFNQLIGTLQSGVTTTFRIVRSGNNVTLSVPSQSGASVTVPLTLVPSLNATNAHLFFGNTATGTTFSNFRVFPLVTADTTPPVISKLAATPSLIWPPNHKMVPVTLDAVATDNVGVTSLKIASVTVAESGDRDRERDAKRNKSDDHEHDGKGNDSDHRDHERHGVRPGDYTITGDLTLKLRAEKGNVYTITVKALDAAGNAATKTVTVSVPHDYSLNRYPF